MRDSVWKILEDLDYVLNVAAIALKGVSRRIAIGVVVPDQFDEFFEEAYAGIQEGTRHRCDRVLHERVWQRRAAAGILLFAAYNHGTSANGCRQLFDRTGTKLLAFFLTMEAFGRIHFSQRMFSQWNRMSSPEQVLHIKD